MATMRSQGFKIGMYHGKTLPDDDRREYKIQRDLFLIGKVKLNFSKNKTTVVRVFAYEVPLQDGVARGECADLLGYDKDFNIYIFELKRGTNQEALQEVINQINGYATTIVKKLPQIEKEFKAAFLLRSRSISFKKSVVKKIILAPREYYDDSENRACIKKYLKGDILFGYFGRIADGNEAKLRRSGVECVNINFRS